VVEDWQLGPAYLPLQRHLDRQALRQRLLPLVVVLLEWLQHVHCIGRTIIHWCKLEIMKQHAKLELTVSGKSLLEEVQYEYTTDRGYGAHQEKSQVFSHCAFLHSRFVHSLPYTSGLR
jgi:hypothetical protein